MTWSKKWYWENTSQIIETSTNNKLPWESVRIIGHRGCGNSPRPIFD